jgi:hypothetical protein
MIYGNDKANDTRCRVCGSLLFSVVRDGAFVHVAMGTLLDDPSIRPTRHIFVGSKALGSPSPTTCRSVRGTWHDQDYRITTIVIDLAGDLAYPEEWPSLTGCADRCLWIVGLHGS